VASAAAWPLRSKAIPIYPLPDLCPIRNGVEGAAFAGAALLASTPGVCYIFQGSADISCLLKPCAKVPTARHHYLDA
jgi:hypothetical protein